jgi:hypothetical protein
MIPLHLSYRMGSDEEIVLALLKACPKSVEIKDRKGRTPIIMAQTTKGTNRELFIKLLEDQMSPALQPTTPASDSTADNNIPEADSFNQRAHFETYLSELRAEHERDLKLQSEKASAKEEALLKEIEAIQAKLLNEEKTNFQLHDRLVEVEEKLELKTFGETSVANKVTAMETSLKATIMSKEAILEGLSQDNRSLNADKRELLLKNKNLYEEVTSLSAQLKNAVAKRESDFTKMEIKLTDQMDKYSTLYDDHSSLKSYIEILEEQLKKKSAHENSLVQQVSSLARQLSTATQDNECATAKYTERLHSIEKEREDLRSTVSKLSRKLFKVAEFLEEIAVDQASVIAKVEAHEMSMNKHTEEYERIVGCVKKQQMKLDEAKLNRLKIIEALKWEEDTFADTDEAREQVLSSLEKLETKHSSSSATRLELARDATEMKEQMDSILDELSNYLPPKEDIGNEDYVDRVLVTLLPTVPTLEGDTPSSNETTSISVSTEPSQQEQFEASSSRNEEAQPRDTAEGDDAMSAYEVREEPMVEDATETGLEVLVVATPAVVKPEHATDTGKLVGYTTVSIEPQQQESAADHVLKSVATSE